jgi:hypothetical protein
MQGLWRGRHNVEREGRNLTNRPSRLLKKGRRLSLVCRIRAAFWHLLMSLTSCSWKSMAYRLFPMQYMQHSA